MASNSRCNWTTEDLQAAVSAVRNDKISLRRAESAYGVSKSIIAFYLHGKAETGAKPGPQSILTAAEETKLVEYVVHMSYGQTKEQILETVKSIIIKDGHPNTFKGGKPGRKWWRLFRKCHPELSLRKA